MDNASAVNEESTKAKKRRKVSIVRPTYGSIRAKHGSWYLQFWDPADKTKRKMVKLAPVNDEFRAKKDVLELANQEADKYRQQRRDPGAPSGSLTVVDFF